MFQDLILEFYLLITIVQIILRMQLHILWWKYLMLSINIRCKQPLSSARIKSSKKYFFDIICHFHAVYATLLDINVHLKL